MSLFIERFVNGLADGSIYALLALALVVVFRSTGQLNFAQGEIGTMGAFFVSTLTLERPAGVAVDRLRHGARFRGLRRRRTHRRPTDRASQSRAPSSWP